MTTEVNELAKELHHLCQSVQSGVKLDQESGSDDGSSKHLRTGVNIAMVESSVLATLLIDKGVFTELEYAQGLVDGMRKEVVRYEKALAGKLNASVKLDGQVTHVLKNPGAKS